MSSTTSSLCAFEGCTRPLYGRTGICNAHYQQRRQGKPLTAIARRASGPSGVCEMSECDRPQSARGFCISHLRMLRKSGDLKPIRDTRNVPEGTLAPSSGGYTRIKMRSHPNVSANGWLSEHTYVMSKMLGRSLLPGENVHHRNGVRTDNRPSNLELWVKWQPAGQRPEDLVLWAREVLARYA